LLDFKQTIFSRSNSFNNNNLFLDFFSFKKSWKDIRKIVENSSKIDNIQSIKLKLKSQKNQNIIEIIDASKKKKNITTKTKKQKKNKKKVKKNIVAILVASFFIWALY